MANLNSWQKPDRVLGGRPFGDGTDGAYSSAAVPTMTSESCSGTAGSTTLTTAGTTLANGNLILIHQTRGTGVGQWEINRVSSGGGTTTLTLQTALNYTYTDSGASQAQAIKIPRYTDATVSSGTWTIPSWNGNTGGILVFTVRGTLTFTGNTSGSGVGYTGGSNTLDPTTDLGEGADGDPGTTPYGAGGARVGDSGGGGGYGTAGVARDTSSTTQGAVYGLPDLTKVSFGGGGGGANANPSGNAGVGGRSGGIVIIFAKVIASPTGTINIGGANGSAGTDRGGGAGSGGGILIVTSSANIGTNKFTSLGGTGGTGTTGQDGGNGGDGRIAIHHYSTVTGTTNPAFEDISDFTLIEKSGMSQII